MFVRRHRVNHIKNVLMVFLIFVRDHTLTVIAGWERESIVFLLRKRSFIHDARKRDSVTGQGVVVDGQSLV